MHRNRIAVGLVVLLAVVSHGCEKKDYGTVTVPPTFTLYNGPDYTLKLPPGWRAVPGNGGVNYYPPDASPPFMSNMFIKSGGSGSPSAIVQAMKKEMKTLIKDATTSDETAASIGGQSAHQARFKGTLNRPPLPQLALSGIIVGVKGGSKGYAFTFIGKEGDYDKHRADIEKVIASFQAK
jgi:hypothetical protein